MLNKSVQLLCTSDGDVYYYTGKKSFDLTVCLDTEERNVEVIDNDVKLDPEFCKLGIWNSSGDPVVDVFGYNDDKSDTPIKHNLLFIRKSGVLSKIYLSRNSSIKRTDFTISAQIHATVLERDLLFLLCDELRKICVLSLELLADEDGTMTVYAISIKIPKGIDSFDVSEQNGVFNISAKRFDGKEFFLASTRENLLVNINAREKNHDTGSIRSKIDVSLQKLASLKNTENSLLSELEQLKKRDTEMENFKFIIERLQQIQQNHNNMDEITPLFECTIEPNRTQTNELIISLTPSPKIPTSEIDLQVFTVVVKIVTSNRNKIRYNNPAELQSFHGESFRFRLKLESGSCQNVIKLTPENIIYGFTVTVGLGYFNPDNATFIHMHEEIFDILHFVTLGHSNPNYRDDKINLFDVVNESIGTVGASARKRMNTRKFQISMKPTNTTSQNGSISNSNVLNLSYRMLLSSILPFDFVQSSQHAVFYILSSKVSITSSPLEQSEINKNEFLVCVSIHLEKSGNNFDGDVLVMVERAICNRLMELKGFSFDDTFVQIKVVRTFKERELFIETNESFRRLCYSQFKGTIGVGKQMKSHGGNVVSFSLKDVLELNKNVYELLE